MAFDTHVIGKQVSDSQAIGKLAFGILFHDRLVFDRWVQDEQINNEQILDGQTLDNVWVMDKNISFQLIFNNVEVVDTRIFIFDILE